MKENIASKTIGNRKIIIELRFEAVPSIIDRKGTLIEAIEKTNPSLFQYWEMNSDGMVMILYLDTQDMNAKRQRELEDI